MAWPWPTMRGRRTVPPSIRGTPQRRQNTPKTAVSAATYYRSELRDVLASRVDDFSRGLIQALLEYALGRPIGFSDQQLVSRLLSTMKKDEYRLSSLIHAITQSKEFQTR